MAYYDSKSDRYVVRIIYDGAPLSGKTTSLTTLATLLGRKGESAVFSPDEASGRTLFFDWLDYDGGLFNGKRIQCQIVSVPGQKALDRRRQSLLSTADAIVFVLDSTADCYQESLDYYRGARQAHAGEGKLAPGILVQANKRDVGSAISMNEIRTAVGDASNVGIIESSAISGDGVRHSFVLGVGLALDRIALLQSSGQLKSGSGDEVDSGESLLDWMRAAEGGAELGDHVPVNQHQVEEIEAAGGDSVIVQQFTTLLSESRQFPTATDNKVSGAATGADRGIQAGTREVPPGAEVEEVVEMPSVGVPAGLIWPPVEGRLIINEVSNDLGLQAVVVSDCWRAESENWSLSSRKSDVFDDPAVGRPALIELVKNHIKLKGLLSGKRCVALSPDGDRWRLWQIVRNEQSAEDALRQLLESSDAIRVADLLFRYSELIRRASELFQSRGVALPFEAKTIGSSRGDPVYLGRVPVDDNEETAHQVSVHELMERELRRLVAAAPFRDDLNVPQVIDRLKKHTESSTDARVIIDTLSGILIGH